ncbi:MAG: Gfo/Idh/MocA family protein, partial [Planctomycetota bacterium]
LRVARLEHGDTSSGRPPTPYLLYCNWFCDARGFYERIKDVFCQKPLTHNVWEARALTLAARKHKVATQMGIQGHAKEGTRLLVEWVRSGAIGPVREIQYWTNRPIWPQGIGRPKDTPPVPPSLDWDLWLSVAPERPYHPAYHPFKWRGFWDFGTGALGDIGCHALDAGFWALELGSPRSVEAETSPVNDETAPKWSIVTYQFPARGDMPPVKVVWYEGGKMPPRPKELEGNRKLGGGGQLFFGDKGVIMAGGTPRLIPEARMKEFERPPKTIPRSPGHVAEWVRACKGGEPAGANFDFAGPLSEMVLLGNFAVRTGKRIEWDGENMRATNAPEANRYVSRVPRKGWEEPYRYGESLMRPKSAEPSPRESGRPARSTVSESDRTEAKAEQLFNMARQAERMGHRSAARMFYARIVKYLPGTSAARRAKEKLAK